MSLILKEDVALINETRSKDYLTKIEKVLKQFETTSEWHDLIPCLTKTKQVRSMLARKLIAQDRS